jgi:hypothetical protein
MDIFDTYPAHKEQVLSRAGTQSNGVDKL